MPPDPHTLILSGTATATFADTIRATTTVVAGDWGFPYDQILQLRVAVSEMYDLVVAPDGSCTGGHGPCELSVRFSPGDAGIEIELSAGPIAAGPDTDDQSADERQALLASLVDDVFLSQRADGSLVVRIVKARSRVP